MKQNIYDAAQTKSIELASKLEGLAYLLRGASPNQGGRRDREALEGISLLLEGLSKEADEVGSMLDQASRPPVA